ncbi:hypothetical protein AMELA_G00068930 [Ameiurus melas]|uniref:Uncharacterized protein n=1 Tax=Ameiurus melas TaxID=219545 RepID=A0A7J6B423_AMEME|nr:hypothetical protein AMELA_G00068930 [Ameiurus melas]
MKEQVHEVEIVGVDAVREAKNIKLMKENVLLKEIKDFRTESRLTRAQINVYNPKRGFSKNKSITRIKPPYSDSSRLNFEGIIQLQRLENQWLRQEVLQCQGQGQGQGQDQSSVLSSLLSSIKLPAFTT